MRPALYFGLTLICLASAASAAEIFRCRTAQGGEFWSSGACTNSGGFMVDIVKVPSGMSFYEQARFADQLRNNKDAAATREFSERERQSECMRVDYELRQLHGKYERGQYVPVEQVGPDQIRTRELNNRRSSLGCQSR